MINYRTAREEHEAVLLEKHLEQVGERVRDASDDELALWYWEATFSPESHREWIQYSGSRVEDIMRKAIGAESFVFGDICDHVSNLILERKL